MLTDSKLSSEYTPELLAPAGDRDSAFAAFHHGADAVYTGLKRFSARAEAVNLTLDELDEITALAHKNGKHVYVTLNTLLHEHETVELVECLAAVADIGPDAVIVQDLGVAHILKRHFPTIRLHASTQLAVHNAAGAAALRTLGFKRVTLARELTIGEIREIVREGGMEVEVFAHGALCYSYSGLCLYSALLRGGSGNRGRCNYPCRDHFSKAGAERAPARFLFSMKDLVLADHIPALKEAGVSALKIEGRKKSATYVAAATALYRRLLDEKPASVAVTQAKWDISSVFSRPWTALYAPSDRNPDVVDTETVGHRGAPVGKVAALVKAGHAGARIRFITDQKIERHDGIQLDVPGRPFGFAVADLRIVNGGKTANAFEAQKGDTVEVGLPADHPPIKPGMIVYCSSSQAVKKKYSFPTPKRGAFRIRKPITVRIRIAPANLTVMLEVLNDEKTPDASVEISMPGKYEPARSAGDSAGAAEQAFSKLGDTHYRLDKCSVDNPERLFVPVSALNEIRRRAIALLDKRTGDERRARIEKIILSFRKPQVTIKQADRLPGWSVKLSLPEALNSMDLFSGKDTEDLVIRLDSGFRTDLETGVNRLADTLGRERIRLALPIITRSWETKDLAGKVDSFAAKGWLRWEVSNISAWSFLEKVFGGKTPDIVCDWPLYAMNRSAIRQLTEMGATGIVLSPENSMDNIEELAACSTAIIVPVYQEVPLFISETCPRASGRCNPTRGCGEWTEELVSGHGERIMLEVRDCRTMAFGVKPFRRPASQVNELIRAGIGHFRVDFQRAFHTPDDLRRAWDEARHAK